MRRGRRLAKPDAKRDAGGRTDDDGAGVQRQPDANHAPKLPSNRLTVKGATSASSSRLSPAWILLDVTPITHFVGFLEISLVRCARLSQQIVALTIVSFLTPQHHRGRQRFAGDRKRADN